MSISTQKASEIFNRVINAYGYSISTSVFDFTHGNQCVFPAFNERGEQLAARLFELYSPKCSSGTYYHYTGFDSFKNIISSGKLRFFSTKKRNSIGEFIPFCEEMALDGYWSFNDQNQPSGEYFRLMDNLFYKSFVQSPNYESSYLWETFADRGKGVRLAFQIDVHSEYPDFRKMAYQKSSSISLIKDLLSAFRESGCLFVPFGLSRMPAFCQLEEFKIQNEFRLIAKRYPGADGCFPFKVEYDEDNDCNFIDCSLTEPTCSLFKLKLIGMETGPNCPNSDSKKAHDLMSLFLQRYP